MALSQRLEDSPWSGRASRKENDPSNQALYNEQHRLALEELVSGGVEPFAEFLRKERIPNFLSDDEVRGLVSGAAPIPRCASLLGDDSVGSMDCSSVTYFPEISDVEPPLLEIGWPGFTAGSYRGVTRAVAHFQPSYGECIYSCKEAARRMIKSAREVIAIVTDSLTDLDVFKDLHEACTSRNVPVYVLLDQSSATAFLNMCNNVGVRPDDLQQMRVRTLSGSTYYMRSGARITGKVHERFMLIDGNRVATGSYRFNWTDGRLNSSNLIELSGQITEHFDEEFRILYAQSLPINTRVPPAARTGGVYERLLLKPTLTSSPYRVRERPVEMLCLTSTPGRGPQAAPARKGSCKSIPVSSSSTLGDDLEVEILAEAPTAALKPSRDAATQTCCFTADSDSQTDPENRTTGAVTPTSQDQDTPPSPTEHGPVARESNRRDCIHKLTSERQNHYSTIRAKLEHMASVLSQRRELADLTNMAALRGQNAAQPAESTGSCPRARCVH